MRNHRCHESITRNKLKTGLDGKLMLNDLASIHSQAKNYFLTEMAKVESFTKHVIYNHDDDKDVL